MGWTCCESDITARSHCLDRRMMTRVLLWTMVWLHVCTARDDVHRLSRLQRQNGCAGCSNNNKRSDLLWLDAKVGGSPMIYPLCLSFRPRLSDCARSDRFYKYLLFCNSPFYRSGFRYRSRHVRTLIRFGIIFCGCGSSVSPNSGRCAINAQCCRQAVRQPRPDAEPAVRIHLWREGQCRSQG